MQYTSEEFLEYIQTYQNILRKVLIEARRKESNRYVLASTNKSKALWKLIKKESGKTQQNQNIIIKQGHNFIKNPRMTADSFNRYFNNIVEKLTLHRNNVRIKIKSTTKGQICTATMFAAPVTGKEMERVILSLNKKASAGYDDIPVRVVKQCMDFIIKPLVHICNISFQQGIFPDQMKIAKIIPLYKNGDKYAMQNYRPISVLSAFLKILEKLMYNRLLSFLKKHHILIESQHGFIENKSTESASQSFIESVQEALDNQIKAIGIFLDLSKAYDVINHKTLLDKLDSYGVRGTLNDWFKSYLSGRTQVVEISYINKKESLQEKFQ
jgi:hypothetical protein